MLYELPRFLLEERTKISLYTVFFLLKYGKQKYGEWIKIKRIVPESIHVRVLAWYAIFLQRLSFQVYVKCRITSNSLHKQKMGR